MNAVEISNLKKYYNKKMALDIENMTINPGEIFGLIGPDGAGKTSLFRILTTLILASEGNIKVFGLDVFDDYKRLRQIIGYMPERFSLYMDLSVEENLKFFAAVFGVKLEENLKKIDHIWSHIKAFSKRKAGALSGGMKQKLALCCALIHQPKLLILDEPTTGVDAVSRIELWKMLQSIKSEGVCVLASTPYMNEATMCDRVALIQDGKILKLDTPAKLKDSFEPVLYRLKSPNIYDILLELRESNLCHSVHGFGQEIHLCLNDEVTSHDIYKRLDSNNLEYSSLEEIKPSMEDCFMEWSSK